MSATMDAGACRKPVTTFCSQFRCCVCHQSPELNAPPLADQDLLMALQFEQVGFVLQTAAEAGQFA